MAAAVLVTAGCTSTRVVSSHFLSAGSTPLATSVDTQSGVWATVPMGQVSDPENTFWQLFYRANGSNQWTDHVDALATATTGGVSIGADGTAVLAGVQTADNLKFSPVIESADSGANWQNGLLPTALARTPQALAIGPAAQAAALVGPAGPRTKLDLSSASNLTSWSTASEGVNRNACAVASLNAVRWVGSSFLIGATCAPPGVAGVFDLASGKWVGPTLPTSDGPVPVIALAGDSTTVSALLVVEGNWVVASSDAGMSNWTESAPLTLDPASVKSIVAEDDGGFLMLSDSSLAEYQPSGSWKQLTAPPAGTETVAREAGGRLSALAVNGTTLTDWDLNASGQWVSGQVLQVPILYGANS